MNEQLIEIQIEARQKILHFALNRESSLEELEKLSDSLITSTWNAAISAAEEMLDETAHEQDTGMKIELWLNWDEGREKLKSLQDLKEV